MTSTKIPLVWVVPYHLQQRFNPIGAEIPIDRQRIPAERDTPLPLNLDFPKVGGGVRLHGRTDVVSLAVGDDIHPFFLCIRDRLGEALHPFPSEQLIIGTLGLDRRDHIADRVDDRFIIGEIGVCGAAQRFPYSANASAFTCAGI